MPVTDSQDLGGVVRRARRAKGAGAEGGAARRKAKGAGARGGAARRRGMRAMVRGGIQAQERWAISKPTTPADTSDTTTVTSAKIVTLTAGQQVVVGGDADTEGVVTATTVTTG